MAKVSPEVLEIVQKALAQYVLEVQKSELSEVTKKTYITHPYNFVRWLDDKFEPGGSVRARR